MRYIILDLVIAAILVTCVLKGANRGLVRTVAFLVIFLVASLGAGFCSDWITPILADKMEPAIYHTLEKGISAATENVGSMEPITFMGMSFDPTSDLYGGLLGAASSASADAAQAAAKFFASALGRLLSAAVVFLVLLIGLRLLFDMLDLVAKLPLVNTVNRLGGAAAGLGLAVMLIFVCLAVAGAFDTLIPPDAAQHTYLYRLFVPINPLIKLFGA